MGFLRVVLENTKMHIANRSPFQNCIYDITKLYLQNALHYTETNVNIAMPELFTTSEITAQN